MRKGNLFQMHARNIMGKNFFGIEEAIKYFKVKPTEQQLAGLADISFSEATLKACKKTHVLVAVLPISILDFYNKFRGLFQDDWTGAILNSYIKDRGDVSWQLVRKTAVLNSTLKTWKEQQKLIANNEETPNERIIVYTIIGHFFATRMRLFERMLVRCSDIGDETIDDDTHACVGYYGFDRLCVREVWDDDYGKDFGLASVRKPI